jgi:hypothetical protein
VWDLIMSLQSHYVFSNVCCLRLYFWFYTNRADPTDMR